MDDDVRVIELLQITLSGRGYSVHTAFDGHSAIEQIEKRKPDLVVLDVRLPRKNGFQVLEEIRSSAEQAQLPVILISGNPSNETRIQGLRLGADDFLTKPFSPRELIMKIRRILDRVGDQKILQIRNLALEGEVARQREQLLQTHADMHANLMRIGTVLQRVEQINDRSSLLKVMEGFVRAIISDVGVESVCLFTRDLHSRRFHPEVWRGLSGSAVLNLAVDSEGFLAQVITLEARTMGLDEFEDYPRAAEELMKLSAAGFTHLTPVKIAGETIALIAGGDKLGGHALEPIDIHLLSVLARAAAASIKNAEIQGESRRAFVDTSAELIRLIEDRYDSVRGHSERVHDLSLGMATEMGLDRRERQTIAQAARLHDLGALNEYETLFVGETTLDDGQRKALRLKASEGVQQMLDRTHMPEVAEAVTHVNEYWDGSGLPDGLAAESIPLASRVVAVANAYDALVHDRPHRRAYPPEAALKLIEERGGHQFDPQVVAHLANALARAESPVTQDEGSFSVD